MYLACLLGHDWSGPAVVGPLGLCKCRRLGCKKEKPHEWKGCRCVRCSASRDQGHDWSGHTCRVCSHTARHRCRDCGGPIDSTGVAIDEFDWAGHQSWLCPACHSVARKRGTLYRKLRPDQIHPDPRNCVLTWESRGICAACGNEDATGTCTICGRVNLHHCV